MTIRDQLLEETDWNTIRDADVADANGGGTVYESGQFELREFDALHVTLEEAARPFSDLVYLVFVSRHAGETGPLLTTHFTGNFGSASLGGHPNTLAVACPTIHSLVVEALATNVPDGYDVGIECTHHGPTGIDVPSLFVEIGSDRDHWQDTTAANAVARTVLSLPATPPESDRVIVGFGGGHYAPRFHRIVRETDWSVGHIGADWCLKDMQTPRREVIRQAFEKSNSTAAVLDGDHPELADVITELGYDVVSETFLRESTGIPLGIVHRLENELTSVDDGLRFGSCVADDHSIVIRELPERFMTMVNGIDRDSVIATVAEHTVGYCTTENGNRVTGPFAVSDDAKFSSLVDDLADLLRQRFDRVTRTDDTITVEERVFDPSRARSLGVPEGPAFGQLANGESVEIDGETITPEMVFATRSDRFRV